MANDDGYSSFTWPCVKGQYRPLISPPINGGGVVGTVQLSLVHRSDGAFPTIGSLVTSGKSDAGVPGVPFDCASRHPRLARLFSPHRRHVCSPLRLKYVALMQPMFFLPCTLLAVCQAGVVNKDDEANANPCVKPCVDVLDEGICGFRFDMRFDADDNEGQQPINGQASMPE